MNKESTYNESAYNKEYYMANKARINERTTKMMQCAKCLRVVQYRTMRGHKLTKKCERDYQKRINPLVVYDKLKDVVGTFNDP